MSIFTEILSVWRKEDLLSEAWEQSLEMLDLSHNMFVKAVMSQFPKHALWAHSSDSLEYVFLSQAMFKS